MAVPAGAAAGGAGDAGVGTKATLQNPDCDPTTGRIRFPTLSAPPCVKPWKDGADNGGATAQGVTKDTIKVVVLYVDVIQDDRSPASTYRNQATGGFSNQHDPIIERDHGVRALVRDVGPEGRVRVREGRRHGSRPRNTRAPRPRLPR